MSQITTDRLCCAFRGRKWHLIGAYPDDQTACGVTTTEDWFYGAVLHEVNELCRNCFPPRTEGYVVVEGRRFA